MPSSSVLLEVHPTAVDIRSISLPKLHTLGCHPALLAGIEVVKASTWEQAFFSRITAARAVELSVLYTVIIMQVCLGEGGGRAGRL